MCREGFEGDGKITCNGKQSFYPMWPLLNAWRDNETGKRRELGYKHPLPPFKLLFLQDKFLYDFMALLASQHDLSVMIAHTFSSHPLCRCQ